MIQAILIAPQQYQLREVPQPVPGKGEALIRVRAAGICGSDIHAYYGRHPFISCPVVPGHEASGEVIALGENAQGLAVGDRVVLRPQKICGNCVLCKSGRYNICNSLQVLGCQETGACSTYYAAPAELFYRLPDGLSYEEGTVLEPLAVGIHAAKKGIPEGLSGKQVLVIGAGAIGNMTAQSAKALGAKTVIITDLSDHRLELARDCGIENTVNTGNKNLDEILPKLVGQDGPDAIYECTASEEGLRQALRLARKGSRIVIVGVYERDISINMAAVQDREYELIGSLMYTDEDYREAIRLAGEGLVDLKSPITHRFPLESIAEAYRFLENHSLEALKVILTI